MTDRPYQIGETELWELLMKGTAGGERIAMNNTEFKPGDKVVYMQTCRGGYGFQHAIPAVFVSAGEKRHTIQVTDAGGSRVVFIHVAPWNLRWPGRHDD